MHAQYELPPPVAIAARLEPSASSAPIPRRSAIRVNGGQDGLCVAEAQSECPRFGQQAFLDSFDRHESVPPVLIASSP